MPFLTNEKTVSFFNWEILVKIFVDSCSENSWKHVVNWITEQEEEGRDILQILYLNTMMIGLLVVMDQL